MAGFRPFEGKKGKLRWKGVKVVGKGAAFNWEVRTKGKNKKQKRKKKAILKNKGEKKKTLF